LRSRRLSSIPQLLNASHNSPPLKRGDTGPGVAAVQDAFADLQYDLHISFKRSGKADGIFGEETDQAVRQFQRRHGLTVDGVVGTNTLAQLDGIIADTPGLDSPDPNMVQQQEAADRGRPLTQRHRAAR
jgi:peptidoglycan hydrolase-like protein with peptidoglycan-binding domain